MTRLKQIIEEKSFRSGNFTLASGKSTTYFFDLKTTMLHPEGSFLIAHAILDKIEELGVRPFAVGGMATGGIPLVTAASMLSYIRGTPILAFFVREDTKDHGTERRVEGYLEPGQTVILLEDVTTTGGSIMKAAKALRAAGCHVETVITVVDRLEGAAENLALEGIALHPVLRRSDFG